MDGFTASELGAILAMQAFSGISLFSVFVLMALGLAIIFGQMGVINMAHGEILTIGAYSTVAVSELATQYAPALVPYYFGAAVVVAFSVAFLTGWFLEFALIRFLYHRPLDTLVATWGVSLILQQVFRLGFGAREVSATLPDWLLGSWQLTEFLEIPLNGLFVLALTLSLSIAVYLLMYRSRWGLEMRATSQNRTMAGATGIRTQRVDRLTFALGCGIAGVAGAAFTTIASTGPTSGSLYIVDTFLVVVFGGAASLIGTFAQSIMEFFMTGSTAKVLTLTAVISILMLRPEGLFALRGRRG